MALIIRIKHPAGLTRLNLAPGATFTVALKQLAKKLPVLTLDGAFLATRADASRKEFNDDTVVALMCKRGQILHVRQAADLAPDAPPPPAPITQTPAAAAAAATTSEPQPAKPAKNVAPAPAPAARAASPPKAAAPPPPSQTKSGAFAPGNRCQFVSMSAKHNGTRATVLFSEDKNGDTRWKVRVDSTWRRGSIKTKNLELLDAGGEKSMVLGMKARGAPDDDKSERVVGTVRTIMSLVLCDNELRCRAASNASRAVAVAQVLCAAEGWEVDGKEYACVQAALVQESAEEFVAMVEAVQHVLANCLGEPWKGRTCKRGRAAALALRCLHRAYHEKSDAGAVLQKNIAEDEKLVWLNATIGKLANTKAPRREGDLFYEHIDYEYWCAERDFLQWWPPTQDKAKRLYPDQACLLAIAPFLFNAAAKRRLFSIGAELERTAGSVRAFQASRGDRDAAFFHLRIRRASLLDDTLMAIQSMRAAAAAGGGGPEQVRARFVAQFKKQLRVEFVGEPGVDAGGLTKEWSMLLVERLFNPDFGMFAPASRSKPHELFFTFGALAETPAFELVGLLVGLAVFNGVLLDVHFPLALYSKLLSRTCGLDELADLDPELGKSLRGVLAASPASVAAMDLDFVLDQPLPFGGTNEVDLLSFDWPAEATTTVTTTPTQIETGAKGEDTAVTVDNRDEYVGRYCHWKLHEACKRPFEAFRRGMLYVLDAHTLSLFSPNELEKLVMGSQELDFAALRDATEYEGFVSDSPAVVAFWNFALSLGRVGQEQLLRFVTGSARAPIGGLKNLRPPMHQSFKIRRVSEDTPSLPVAHTCFNRLDLPAYASAEKLAKKLTTAMTESAGFGLV